MDRAQETRINREAALENMVLARDIVAAKGAHVFLLFGTLLGAVRERDFIPHDDDVDMGILEREQDAFFSSFAELERNGFRYYRTRTEMHMHSFVRKDEVIDFFLVGEKKTAFGRRWSLDRKASVSADALDTFDEIDFLGQTFKVPHDPRKVLRSLFGKTWQVPIVGKRSRVDLGVRFAHFLRSPLEVASHVPEFIRLHLVWAFAAKKAMPGAAKSPK